jgi:urea transporter
LLQFTTIDVSNAIKPTSPSDFTGPRPDYTWVTWLHGITMGIAEIFFQDNWVTEVIILIGIAINTRIGWRSWDRRLQSLSQCCMALMTKRFVTVCSDTTPR